MIKKLLSWVLLLVALSACKDSAEPDPSMMGYQYYPLAVGDYRTYYVTDIRFQFDKGDTTRFQLREVVHSTFTDQTNTLNYRIERFTRPNSNSKWMADSVFVVTKSLTNVMLMQDNTKRVKLVFPVKEGKTWAGDAFNDRTTDDLKEQYSYQLVNEPFVFDNSKLIFNKTPLSYDSTATVVIGPQESRFKLDDRREVYAPGIGLIYRIFNYAVLCAPSDENPDCENEIIEGRERHEVLIEHGKL